MVNRFFNRTLCFSATVDDCDAEEFLYEAAIMRRLKHPNILSSLGVSVYEGAQYVLLPLMNNGDLRSYMKRHSTVSIVRSNGMITLGVSGTGTGTGTEPAQWVTIGVGPCLCSGAV